MTCRSHILHAFAVAAMLAGAAFAQEEGERKMSAAERLRNLPKLATACDGLVGVLAADVPGDSVGFRLPILQFVSSQVRDLERAYKLQMPKREGIGIFVNVGDGRTNDTRVVARRTRRPGGDVQTRIVLPSPGFSDLDELRFAVAQAYFRAWIFRNGGSTNELPDWVVQGAVRAANVETAHDDTYLVAWMKEKYLVKPLLDNLASGKPWDGKRLAADMTGETEPFLQDRASDERFARLTRAVLSPGRASDWDLSVFTSRLMLYPPVFDRREGISYTFREAVYLAAERKNVREAAWQKAREMPFCAIGRGDALADVAMSYRTFLVAAAQGKPADELKPLLEAADGKMNAILEEQKK